jgi:hypothetical protein
VSSVEDSESLSVRNLEVEIAQLAAAQLSEPALPFEPAPAPVEAVPAAAHAGLEEAASHSSQGFDPWNDGDSDTAPPASLPSSVAISLDEMWERVSGELEKPIFPVEPSIPSAEEAPAVVLHPATAWEPAADIPQIDELELDQEQNSAPAEAVEDAAAKAPAAVEISAAYLLGGIGSAPAQDQIETAPEPESHREAPDTPPPAEPPRAESPVIGRYEAEGTAYIMFADGSIEAQSEAGIFRFASMAELKAFIEDRQTAEV